MNANPASGSQPDPDGALLASVDGLAVPLSEQECIFHDHFSGESHVMTLDVLRAMDLCRPFRSFDDHVTAIEAEIPGLQGQSEAIRRVVQSLVDRGLVRSAERALARLDASYQRDRSEATVVALVDERGTLGELLAKAPQLARRRWLVLDGSRSSDALKANRKRVESARADGLDVHYLDREWRIRLARQLAKELELEESVLEDGLTSSHPSAVWNAALLACAGHRMVILGAADQLAIKQPTTADRGWHLQPTAAMPKTLVRADAGFDSELAAADLDPIAEQDELCGRELRAGFSELQPSDLAGLTWREVSELNGSRIIATRPGTWGDARQTSNTWIYQIPTGLARMGLSKDDYFTWLRRPLAAEGADRYQIGHVSSSLPGSLDNRALVPPAPIGVDEGEFGFGAWLHFTHPDGVVVHLPWMTEFRHPESYRPEAESTEPGLGRFLAEYTLTRIDSCWSDAPDQRLGMLRAVIEDLADATDERLQTALGEFIANHFSDSLRRMQVAANQAEEAPEFWKADAKSWIQHDVTRLTAEVPPTVADWKGQQGVVVADRLRSQLRQQVEWLALWPTLWSSCDNRQLELLDI